MSSSSAPSPTGELGSAASVLGYEDVAGLFEKPKLLDVRRTHAAEEAYLKAVGLVNYLYVVLFGPSAAYFAYIVYSHLAGKVSAD